MGAPAAPTRRRFAPLTAGFLLLACVGCELFPESSATSLDYHVRTLDGEIAVSVKVSGGPRPTAWVGFGDSPLSNGGSPRRIHDVRARTAEGAAMRVQSVGEDAYRVDVETGTDWLLEYRATIGSPPPEFYHRASSSSDQHLMIVGVDVWARLFASPEPTRVAPADRALGEVDRAIVRFDGASLPGGWTVVSAAREFAFNEFELDTHPARSAFAVGPYRYHDVAPDIGMRAAIHADWKVARESLVSYSQALVRVQTREFGPPPGNPALMIFTPLPESARPTDGVRSAGMVWDRSLLLFAGAAPAVPQDNPRVREMVAIFLGHELFHLYVPWGIPVTQPLSWLSEGWAEHVGRSSARTAGVLSAAGADRSLRDAYERYRQMGGARAGSLQNAAESAAESLRPLLYMRGELVFRILSLEWAASGKRGSFDRELWLRLATEYVDGNPLEPHSVSSVLSTMVAPSTVRRVVDGAAVITLPELELGRR